MFLRRKEFVGCKRKYCSYQLHEWKRMRYPSCFYDARFFSSGQAHYAQYTANRVKEVECHPYLNQSKLLDFCMSKDIVLVAYSALGTHRDKHWVDQSTPVLLDDPVLASMAKKYKRTPALIALRYQIQRGVVILSKSLNEARIKENMQVFEFQLHSEDMKALDGLNRNLLYVAGVIHGNSKPSGQQISIQMSSPFCRLLALHSC
ncbi:hypothetical protein STEG23_025210 [Scotinomys teguina]